MADAIGWIISHLGYAGVMLLGFAETVFPPLPSEVIIPLAAFHGQQAQMSLPGVIAAGTLGSMTGNYLWYALAWRFGMTRFHRLVERHGRWLTVEWRDIEKSERYFLRHGTAFICLGRMLPAIRTFISAPAGLSRIAPGRYLLWSSLGTMAWTGCLAGAGWHLGAQYRHIGAILTPLTAIIIAPFAAWYLWRLGKSFRR